MELVSPVQVRVRMLRVLLRFYGCKHDFLVYARVRACSCLHVAEFTVGAQ